MDALRFIKFCGLQQWDIKRFVQTSFSSHMPIVPLGDHIIEQSKKYDISNPKQIYGILGVNNKTGIFDAYQESGAKIKQKYKKMEVDWIAYNPYRVNVGSIGIKRTNHVFEYISPAYVVFSCLEDLLPSYLYILMRTPSFNKIIRDNTTGSVRQSLSFATLKHLRIPLPAKIQQDEIISRYKQTIAEAEAKESEALKLGNDIEQYLLDKLGICFVNNKNKTNGVLQTVRFSNLNRWDVYNINNSFIPLFEESLYPIVNIGNVFDFTTRTWDKREPVFNYVEIGAVDPLLGIVSSQEIKTSKAPSRATQVIREGDLIIGTTRPYLKKFAIVNDKYDSCVCSSGFQVIVPNTETNVEFLYEYLKSSIAVAQFEFFMTGALYPAITTKDLKKILIPLPPIDIQNKIVAHIAEMKSQIKMLKQQAIDLRDKALKDFEKEIFE